MRSTSLRVALYQPDIPQNLGAIVRSCACFGSNLEVIGPCGFPLSKRVLRRTALDYLEHINLNYHSDYQMFKKNLDLKSRIVLLTVRSTMSIWDFNFQNYDIILLGSESRGVPEGVREEIYHQIKIPMVPEARCLNVANAASVALAEAARQIGF